jgi:hypothetical protein
LWFVYRCAAFLAGWSEDRSHFELSRKRQYAGIEHAHHSIIIYFNIIFIKEFEDVFHHPIEQSKYLSAAGLCYILQKTFNIKNGRISTEAIRKERKISNRSIRLNSSKG